MAGYTHFNKVSADVLAIGQKGSESDITATPAEINRVADKSTSLVTITEDTTLTMDEHDGKTVVLNHASGVTVTLPAATVSVFDCTLLTGVALSGGSHVVQVANATDVMNGSKATGVDDDGEGATGFQWMAETGDDTITMNGGTTGGQVGDSVKVLDYKSGFFLCDVKLTQNGTSATPFTASVS